ncbi:SDR family NAD(P)-dependent oxidoreductase [Halostagnicola sp. A-GB9-2]|uniref:SDR family NAD(P)-dependent oxidoreductase n=1 Tax=Halostagnicola sp. A-GB9-2 TaxID=3048066 RepID=UPI0024C0E320|nr:SDR family NAD(P)-dependent oxidoreductase [Halostagnicola sp. A-GB9-2]MDJ1431310.1 SDR family NAD(P)-dependent oxidoreductase [Halostagnicola sp. A-GB9-2]
MAVIVTGGSRGIGRAIATRLAHEHDIVVNYRSDGGAAEETVEQVESAGASAVAIQADVTEPTEVTALLERTRDTFDSIEAVINNAGIVEPAPIEDLEPETFEEVVATNLTGAFSVTQAAAPDLREIGGDVVMVSSIGGTAGTVDASYAASKAGLHGLTRSLARELGDDGVQVNAVAPGPVETDMNDEIVDYLESVEFRGHEGIDTHLPQYACEPDAIAHSVEYLIENSYVQGEVLCVNGGMQFR